jgi:hypothetical protein
MATVATLGLNPSRMEFQNKHGNELSGPARRFETLASLGVADLVSASDEVLSRVVRACDAYFSRNPYKRWFDHLLPMLQAVDASYYDGSACHLDLVQWATDPVWGKIRELNTRERLLADDAEFLRQQLAWGKFKVLLVNGRDATKSLTRLMGISLQMEGKLAKWSLSSGYLPTGTRVIAWSLNVQSSWGVTEAHCAELARRVRELSRGE